MKCSLTVYYVAGGSVTTFHDSREEAAWAALRAFRNAPEPLSGCSIAPGRECTACIGNDPYTDAPCPVCGGTGIDDRPDIVSEFLESIPAVRA